MPDNIISDFVQNTIAPNLPSNEEKLVAYEIGRFLEEADYLYYEEKNNTHTFTTKTDDYRIYAPNFETAYRRFLEQIWNKGRTK